MRPEDTRQSQADTASKVLVSVVVVTFNSGATVEEALDSVAGQDYGPLELIVCDDASSDDTMALVEHWTRQHADRFVRIELLPSPRNLGVCGNLTRGYTTATGTWIKGIAGDDLLLPGAITRYMVCAKNSDAAVIVGLVRKFSDSADGRQFGELMPTPEHRADVALTGPAALHRWTHANPVPAPSTLIRRSALEAIGGISLKFAHLDDWPLWIRMQENGMRFQLLDEALVGYRQSPGSISARRSAGQVDVRYLEDLRLFYLHYQRRYLPPLARIDRGIEVLRWMLAAGVLRRHPFLYRLTAVLHLLSPLRWIGLGRPRSTR